MLRIKKDSNRLKTSNGDYFFMPLAIPYKIFIDDFLKIILNQNELVKLNFPLLENKITTIFIIVAIIN